MDGKILGALSEKEKKRQEVIFELIQTEKDFVRDLHIIITIFLQPLRKKKILPPKDLTVLFSNVEQLVPVNTVSLPPPFFLHEIFKTNKQTTRNCFAPWRPEELKTQWSSLLATSSFAWYPLPPLCALFFH